MIILTLRTDKPEAEIGLYDDKKQLAYVTWQAHRALAETLHSQIDKLLSDNQLSWSQIQGIVAYKGPGSFTGLRIGLSVANSLAYSLKIPIVSNKAEDWLNAGLDRLSNGANETVVLPEYGAAAHITLPRK